VQERAAVTVDAIVTAVERVLEQRGPSGLSTNRVAEVAGVSIGTLYQYFPNKEALVGALHQRYLDQTVNQCRAVLASAGAIPIAQIPDLIAAALLAAKRVQRPIHRQLMELRSAAAFHEHHAATLDRVADELAGFLASRPDASFPDPKTSAYVLVRAVHGVTEGVVHFPGDRDAERIAAEAARMVADYVNRFRTP
jgi:AcrR family transcriptional regulator